MKAALHRSCAEATALSLLCSFSVALLAMKGDHADVQKAASPAQAALYMPCSLWLKFKTAAADCRTSMWTGRTWLSAFSNASLI